MTKPQHVETDTDKKGPVSTFLDEHFLHFNNRWKNLLRILDEDTVLKDRFRRKAGL